VPPLEANLAGQFLARNLLSEGVGATISSRSLFFGSYYLSFGFLPLLSGLPCYFFLAELGGAGFSFTQARAAPGLNESFRYDFPTELDHSPRPGLLEHLLVTEHRSGYVL